MIILSGCLAQKLVDLAGARLLTVVIFVIWSGIGMNVMCKNNDFVSGAMVHIIIECMNTH